MVQPTCSKLLKLVREANSATMWAFALHAHCIIMTKLFTAFRSLVFLVGGLPLLHFVTSDAFVKHRNSIEMHRDPLEMHHTNEGS